LKKKIFSVFKYLVFLSIGIALFWLAIRGEDIHQILNEFKHANYFWIGVSVTLMVVSHVIRALRWNLLIGTLNYKTKTITTFYAVMVGYFVNLAVPRLGEISRCGVLAKHDKVPVNSLFGTVIAERVFDVFTLFLIIVITILSQLGFLSKFIQEQIILPAEQKFSGNAIFIISGAIILLVLAVVALYLYRIFKRKVVEHTFAFKVKNIIEGFFAGIKTIKHVENKKLFLLYSFLLWFVYYLTIYIAFFAMHATSDLQPEDALTLLAIGSIGILIPTPGGIGAYQYIVGLTLIGVFAIAKIPASSFANILYFSQWFMIIIIGGISWFLLILSEKRNLKNETK
jgi:glycosyltransferase 2 family protein